MALLSLVIAGKRTLNSSPRSTCGGIRLNLGNGGRVEPWLGTTGVEGAKSFPAGDEKPEAAPKSIAGPSQAAGRESSPGPSYKIVGAEAGTDPCLSVCPSELRRRERLAHALPS